MMTQTGVIQNIRTRVAENGISSRRLAAYVAVSICAHALFFWAGIWLVQFKVPYQAPEVVQVDLVSFDPGEPGGPSVPEPEKSPVSPPSSPPPEPPPETAVSTSVAPAEPVPPKEPEPVQVLKPDVSLKSKPKNLEELMAQTPEPKPAPEAKPKPDPKPKPEAKPESRPRPKSAEPPPEKKEPDSQQQLAQAMERLAREVEAQDKVGSSSNTGTGPVAGSGSGAGDGRRGGTPLDLYKMILQSVIQQNWVFNEMLAGLDQNLEVRILIKILKNGEIRDIIYETRSGNPYLDQSARRAIQRANPLPALPKGMASYDVVVIFTPKGLR
jgi:TonB family protein